MTDASSLWKGCLVAAVLFVSPALGQTGSQDGATDSQPHPQTEVQQASSTADANAAFWKDKDGSADTYRAICQKPKDKDQADLCQQWRVAEAALQQANWAFWQFVASAAGMAGLVVSLGFTGWAAVAASRAAIAAEISASAIPKLERAYIFMEIEQNFRSTIKMTINGNADSPNVKFIFRNYGKTPAFITEVTYELHHLSELKGIRYFGKNITTKEEVIGSEGGSSKEYFHPLETGPLDKQAAENILAGKSFIWFHGRVCYSDILREQHETTFCWRYNGQGNSFDRYSPAGENWNRRT